MSEPKKHMDVAKPRKMAADATSRPVIVGHRPMVTDPMVNDKKELQGKQGDALPGEEGQPSVASDVAKHEGLVLQPLGEKDKNDEGGPAASDATNEQREPDDASSEEEDNGDKKKDAVVISEGGAITPQTANKQEQEKKNARAEELQKMVDDKRYFVPISRPKVSASRGGRFFAVIIFATLLLATVAYLLIDAQVVNNNIKLPYEFFKSSQVGSASSSAAQNSNTIANSSTAAATLKDYSNTALGVAFKYPSDWTVKASKDAERPTVDVITIVSPAAKANAYSLSAKTTTEKTVKLVTEIFVENTTDSMEYSTFWYGLSTCMTTPITLADKSGSYNLAYVLQGAGGQGKYVAEMALSKSTCAGSVGSNAAFINDQIQFSGKRNTYAVFSEYRVNETDKRGTGAVVMLATDFKTTTLYKQVEDIYKSIKEV